MYLHHAECCSTCYCACTGMSIHIIIKQGACPHISPNPFMHSMPPKDNMENQGQELPAHGHHILQPHNMATQAAALQQPKKKHMQSPAPVATSVLASIMFGAQRGPKTSICNSAVRHTHFIFLKACFSIYWKLLRCPEHNILPTCDRLGRYLFASCLLARLWVPRPCANKTQCRCAWMVCHFNVMMDNCIWQ